MRPGSAGVLRVGFGVLPKQSCLVAQAASLQVSAACRDCSENSSRRERIGFVAGRLPATAGWQPALPRSRKRDSKRKGNPLLRALFEGPRLTAQKREGLTGEMEG